jgi:hypothetical protein
MVFSFGWIHLYFRVVPDAVTKPDWLTTDQDQINLRMRHAARFDHVFDRRFFMQRALNTPT